MLPVRAVPRPPAPVAALLGGGPFGLGLVLRPGPVGVVAGEEHLGLGWVCGDEVRPSPGGACGWDGGGPKPLCGTAHQHTCCARAGQAPQAGESGMRMGQSRAAARTAPMLLRCTAPGARQGYPPVRTRCSGAHTSSPAAAGLTAVVHAPQVVLEVVERMATADGGRRPRRAGGRGRRAGGRAGRERPAAGAQEVHERGMGEQAEQRSSAHTVPAAA